MLQQASNESFSYDFLISVEKMEKNQILSLAWHSEVGPNFAIMGFTGKIAVLRHLTGFFAKTEESRQNCNFTSKTHNYKIRSNFRVPGRTKILIFFHFFNSLSLKTNMLIFGRFLRF